MKKRTKQLVCSALVGMVSISSVSAMYLTPQAAESYSKMMVVRYQKDQPSDTRCLN